MLTFHPSGQVHDGAPIPTGAVWVDLLNAEEAELRLIEDHAGLTLPKLDDLRRIDRSSQMSIDGQQLRVAAPIVAKADTDHPELSYVGLILTPKLLITVRFDDLKVFDATADRVCSGARTVESAEVFVELLEALIDRESDLLEEAREFLDQISHQVFRRAPAGVKVAVTTSASLRATLQKLGRIGDRISMIRESLMCVGRVAPYAREMAKGWIKKPYQERLTAISQDVDSLNLFEEHLSNKVQFLLDATLGFINNQQNDMFRVLTIASIVGIPPVFVAGLYGMNFQNQPEYHWAYGYEWGWFLIIVSALLPVAWFKWRGWW